MDFVQEGEMNWKRGQAEDKKLILCLNIETGRDQWITNIQYMRKRAG